MTNQTVNFLRTFNRWRRGDASLEQPSPRVIGQMLDDACEQIERLEGERDADRRTIELLRESRDGYKRMAGVSPDWETAESVRDKFSPMEDCGDE